MHNVLAALVFTARFFSLANAADSGKKIIVGCAEECGYVLPAVWQNAAKANEA